MDKNKTSEPETKPVKDLPTKSLDSKRGETVKGGDKSASAPTVSEIVITKRTDIATPKL